MNPEPHTQLGKYSTSEIDSLYGERRSTLTIYQDFISDLPEWENSCFVRYQPDKTWVSEGQQGFMER